ncbi:hypothetical protein [Nesterenkonia muleiensis]|uniref:hypothetical protein n=1 Tax=Nesterenkonia muleiensis TaxID=2282648 RepID=UPI000E74CA0A|nr:hypothetical protein [Nesterenkonia muleiensis]
MTGEEISESAMPVSAEDLNLDELERIETQLRPERANELLELLGNSEDCAVTLPDEICIDMENEPEGLTGVGWRRTILNADQKIIDFWKNMPPGGTLRVQQSGLKQMPHIETTVTTGCITQFGLMKNNFNPSNVRRASLNLARLFIFALLGYQQPGRAAVPAEYSPH